MVFGIRKEKLLVFSVGVLIRTELGGDFGRPRNAGGEVAVGGGILLHRREHFFPFYKLRLFRFQNEYVGGGLRKPLTDRIAGGTQIVDFVGGAEFQQLAGDLVGFTPFLLNVGVNLGHVLVAADLVFLVRKRFDRLGIGVGEVSAELGNFGTCGNRDDARIALEFELGSYQNRNDLFIRNGGRRIARTVLLHDLGHDLVGTPVGNAGVENFRIIVAEIRRGIGQDSVAGAGSAAHIHREFTFRFVDGRRYAVNRE